MSEKADMMKKIVAPIEKSDGGTFWLQIGILGVKNGKIWMRFNSTPTKWDGYCMAVEMEDRGKEGGNAKTGKAEPETERGEEVPF